MWNEENSENIIEYEISDVEDSLELAEQDDI